MEAAMHIKTKVLPGKRIEITAPGLVEGDPVDVFVVLPTHADRSGRSIMEIIKSRTEPPLFRTAEEVDRFLDSERDSWEH